MDQRYQNRWVNPKSCFSTALSWTPDCMWAASTLNQECSWIISTSCIFLPGAFSSKPEWWSPYLLRKDKRHQPKKGELTIRIQWQLTQQKVQVLGITGPGCWWFQPIWKIFAKLDHLPPKLGWTLIKPPLKPPPSWCLEKKCLKTSYSPNADVYPLGFQHKAA